MPATYFDAGASRAVFPRRSAGTPRVRLPQPNNPSNSLRNCSSPNGFASRGSSAGNAAVSML
ncbi:hypothetical protein D3C80_2213930 [compost metagenome]